LPWIDWVGVSESDFLCPAVFKSPPSGVMLYSPCTAFSETHAASGAIPGRCYGALSTCADFAPDVQARAAVDRRARAQVVLGRPAGRRRRHSCSTTTVRSRSASERMRGCCCAPRNPRWYTWSCCCAARSAMRGGTESRWAGLAERLCSLPARSARGRSVQWRSGSLRLSCRACESHGR
jgi:hypothetical protein